MNEKNETKTASAMELQLSTDAFKKEEEHVVDPLPEHEPLTLDKLAASDKPSIICLGMVGAQALKKDGVALFMVDVLGRVRLMPKALLVPNARPKIAVEELNELSEDDAILAMLAQGDNEEEISNYLALRETAALIGSK